MTEHLVSSHGAWSEGRVGLPTRSRPEPSKVSDAATSREPAQAHDADPSGSPSEITRSVGTGVWSQADVWTQSERGWSPTSWRQGVR